MKEQLNIVLHNKNGRPFLADAYYKSDEGKYPLLIFCHGYKGFKDWGAWDLLARALATAHFYVVKFNFSHNGTTLQQPHEFADLEAFGQNNYARELDDLDVVINHFTKQAQVIKERVMLMGHSRGGGIALLKSAEDPRVKMLCTLAGVSDFYSRFPKGNLFNDWKEKGVYYVENARTKIKMPHYFQFFENYMAHPSRFHIQQAVQSLSWPYLIIHGGADEAVAVKEAENLHSWAKNSTLIILPEATHTFGTKHPWTEKQVPRELEKAAAYIVSFYKENS